MKIPTQKFLGILRANAGIYGMTARAIEREYGVKMSRQAVRDRAQRHLEELADIDDEIIDLAEEALHELLKSENEAIRFRAASFVLNTKGRRRGYTPDAPPLMQTMEVTPISFRSQARDGEPVPTEMPTISFKWEFDDEPQTAGKG